MSMQRLSLASFVVVALVAASCAPATQTTQEEQKVFGPNTVLGEIQANGEIVVGIESDLLPYSKLDPVTGEVEGFVVELADALAAALGVKAIYVGASGPELMRMVTEERVDLAFPAVAMTEDLAGEYTFTNPIYVAHQRLLVRTGSSIKNVQSLGSKPACSFIDPETEVPLQQLDTEAKVIDSIGLECRHLLDAGKVDAVTAADVHLMSIAEEVNDAEIVGDDLTTEGYGVVAATSGMAHFANNTLSRVESDGRWLSFYELWLAPFANAPSREPPDLSLEEAAALYPSDSG
jgi:polar amino acid transport system substrate-binding protein